MLTLLQKIINKYTAAFVPPIVHGASSMIKQLAEEEEKILSMNAQHKSEHKKHTPPPKVDISNILEKYVSKDISKEAYVFIRIKEDCSVT